MQRRGLRFAILTFLLACGGLAAFYIWTSERRVHELDEQQRIKEETIGSLQASIATISTAQQAYVDYGRRDVGAFTRVSLLIDRMTTDAAGLRATGESAGGADRLEEFWTALSALMGAESRARENLAAGDTATAADSVLSSREQVGRLESSLRAFREAELDRYRNVRGAAVLRSWSVLGTAATVWFVGLVAFALVPLRPEATVVVSPTVANTPAQPVLTGPTIDLAATAAAASDLSRLSDAPALTDWLARVATILDARGLIIWISYGDSLVAAAAHGYEAAVLERFPPIARTADNATAAAWRTGELRTVAADASGYGAIVAPMHGPSGCTGVFAAEVVDGRDADGATCAVAAILASQLACVLAAWPAASSAPAGDRPLDRQAAAS